MFNFLFKFNYYFKIVDLAYFNSTKKTAQCRTLKDALFSYEKFVADISNSIFPIIVSLMSHFDGSGYKAGIFYIFVFY